MDGTNLLTFTGISIMLTLMPGPDILFVITQSITRNPKDGIAVALGLCTGLMVHTTAAALGVSAVLYHSSLAFQTLKVAGALYLFYLAWQSLREAGAAHTGSLAVEGRKRPFFALYRKGILMNLLNPKVSLFFLAFLPQFVSPEAGSVSVQMILLGVIFMVQAFLVFAVVSLAAHRLGRNFMANVAVSRWVDRGKAGIYALLGARLLSMEHQ
ncbi:threonine/homoserine/homoserine lactone efflux protein [Melghirimyces profundicolus]|uniref:Threonine/homoserine/homoserine lactone efflux protein n=1 Tax=Melghirimyces profundicolus TaxID=1242148 RepID=A0A2T6C7K5_9BACL|nr:LysE family translocator [Melghirimyces profundicolus]PTX64297.1 threonine/homoserine/homoserine lactone efflux protein [Melghirimyces profundicolus]